MNRFVKHLKESNFETQVLQSKGVVLVDFGAPWCPPCRALEPILEELAREYESVAIYSVNVDEEMNLAAKYGIRSLPTVFVLKDGKVVEQLLGKLPHGFYREVLERVTDGSIESRSIA